MYYLTQFTFCIERKDKCQPQENDENFNFCKEINTLIKHMVNNIFWTKKYDNRITVKEKGTNGQKKVRESVND